MSSSSSRKRLLCGPQWTSYLYLQNEHVSRSVWAGEKTKAVRCRRYEGQIWDVPIHKKVLKYVDLMGFGGILRSGKAKILDHHLITALIERWRPETHTFHFPIGEATVTLEDVQLLWGLKVNGDPVTGYQPSQSREEWARVCVDLLGVQPDGVELNGSYWKSLTLSDHLSLELGDDEDSYVYLQRARVYCMLIIGGLLAPNGSGNKIPFFYMQFVEDPRRCGQLSWGSATLALLYHYLCEAACGQRTDVGGPLTLLQMWAWERIPNIRPEMSVNLIQPSHKPCAAMWSGPASMIRSPQHCTEYYRDQFSLLREGQFIWTPYAQRPFVPPMCLEGQAIWSSSTFLIFWHMVEPHCAQRVLRQFGCSQPLYNEQHRFHLEGALKSDRRGKAGRNWEEHHRQYIEGWNLRHECTYAGFDAPTDPNQTEEYMAWFRKITVGYYTQPGSQAEHGIQEAASSQNYAVETIQRACQFIKERDLSSQPDLYKVLEILEDGLQVCGVGNLMDEEPSQRTELDVNMPVRRKVRRSAKGKAKSTQGESSSMRLGDDNEEFATPSPPDPHDLDDLDLQTPFRRSVDIGNVVEDTPNPPSKYSKGNPFKIRNLFSRKK